MSPMKSIAALLAALALSMSLAGCAGLQGGSTAADNPYSDANYPTDDGG